LVGERASVDFQLVSKGRNDLKEVTSGYKIDDVYNFDETALYYRMAPNRTKANVSVSGTKESRENINRSVLQC
jgi:hypothetical protein